jgi:hypothetical protein
MGKVNCIDFLFCDQVLQMCTKIFVDSDYWQAS